MVDISKNILSLSNIDKATQIIADCESIPLKDESVDCVGAFAFLHHVYSLDNVFKEFYRILKNGGFFYSDHDISQNFTNTFRIPLAIYRATLGHNIDMIKHHPQITKKEYDLSEFRGKTGLSSETIYDSLSKIGFKKIIFEYHWDGMGFIENYTFCKTLRQFFYRKSLAPILRIKAQK